LLGNFLPIKKLIMSQTTAKANRLNNLEPDERGDRAIAAVIQSQLKQLIRISPDPEVKAAAERRLKAERHRFPINRRKAS
jgi:hypothetical protein